LYYLIKYRPFARERRPHDGRRGLLALQIDALSYADLRRAIAQGYAPTIRRLLRGGGYNLRRWFCGLPAATPYCQAGILYGENAEIPAFRFYDKTLGRVVTCNSPDGVRYIRDRLTAPGVLAGGSSYVNLLDGDAQTVAFTVATRQRMSIYRRLGGTRMLLLIAFHPVRVVRMIGQSVVEWLREEWERFRGEMTGRQTYTEGIFPFIRVFTGVVVRELQTMAIMLDLYLGVPIIYSTYMQYDEMAHHFGPRSRQALGDLKRTDARLREILRMVRLGAGRGYDVVILSDHGMTPSVSYRFTFGESLGATVGRILTGDTIATPGPPLQSVESFAEDTEYSDVGAQLFDAAALVASPEYPRVRSVLSRWGDWVRRHYGLRELIVSEKYRVDNRNAVVVTYSSCLAHVYFADDQRPLTLSDIAHDRRRSRLYHALLAHPGIGLLATRTADGTVHLESRTGRGILQAGRVRTTAGSDPLAIYGSDARTAAAVESLVLQSNGGDIVLFGAFDGQDIVSFDDQVGAHGSAGGDQVFPFVMAPTSLGLQSMRLDDARDIHRDIMSRYADPAAGGSRTPTPASVPVTAGSTLGANEHTRARNSSPDNRSASASPSSAVRR
jgi:hypothetical protein